MIGALIAKKAIRSGFDALNKGDLERFLNAWSEDATWVYPGKVKAGGQFTGKAEVKNWFEGFIRQFPQRNFILNHICVENVFDMIGNNTVSAQWDLELTNRDGLKISNSGVTILRIKGSRVIFGEDFLRTSDGDDYKRAWGEIQ